MYRKNRFLAILFFLFLLAICSGSVYSSDLLIKNLQNGSILETIEAVQKLGDFEDPKVLAPLIEALNNPDEEVRMVADRSLGQLPNYSSVKPLLQSLNLNSIPFRLSAKRNP